MLRHDPNFIRIPVTARGMGGTASYWLGPDHLLIVEVHGAQERYRRFYYRDIQSIALRRTEWGRVGSAVLGFLGFFCGLAASVANDTPARVALGIFAGAFVLGTLWNLLRGTTCASRIRTAVQADDLPGLHRLRAARKVTVALRERVLAVQGPLPVADFATSVPLAATIGAVPSVTVTARATPAAPALHNVGYLGRYHRILCWLLLVLAGLSLVDLFWQGDELDGVSLAAILAALVINVLALVRQQGSRLPDRLRWLTWTVMVFHLVMLGIAIGYAIFMSVNHPGKMDVHENPWDNPLLLGLDFASIIVGVCAGVAGLMMLAAFRREALTPPPLAPPQTAPPRVASSESLPPPHPPSATADWPQLDAVPEAPASGPAGGETLPQRAGSEIGAPPLPAQPGMGRVPAEPPMPPVLPPPPPGVS